MVKGIKLAIKSVACHYKLSFKATNEKVLNNLGVVCKKINRSDIYIYIYF